MAKHRIIPFDDPRTQEIIDPSDPRYPAIRRRMFFTFGKSILGYLGMGALCYAALAFFGFSYHLTFGFGLVWLLLPIPLWWFCAKIALAMSHAVPADPNNPEHARLIALVDKVWQKSGLKFKPPVYVSPDESPNAFATGPIHRKAVVAATAGLFKIGLTDEEIMAVFAHELGHVRNYDVAINSFLSVLSSLFFLIVDAGVSAWLGTLKWLQNMIGGKWGRGFITNIFFYFIFQITGSMTRIIQMFVVRSRESGADATGAYILGNPCALATALEKLVDYVEKHRPKPGTRENVFYRAFRPMMTIDPLYDTLAEPTKATGLWARVKAVWAYLMLTHPPVPERVHELERMNGGACPRI